MSIIELLENDMQFCKILEKGSLDSCKIVIDLIYRNGYDQRRMR